MHVQSGTSSKRLSENLMSASKMNLFPVQHNTTIVTSGTIKDALSNAAGA